MGAVRSGPVDAVAEMRVEGQEAGVHEDELVDPIGVLGRQAGGNQPAHRVADDAGPLDPQTVHRGHQLGGRLVEHEARLAFDAPKPGRSIAWTLNERSSAGVLRCHQRAEPASPWSRISGGPSPLMSETTGPCCDQARVRGCDAAISLRRSAANRPAAMSAIFWRSAASWGVVGGQGRDESDAALERGLVDDRAVVHEGVDDVGQLVGVRKLMACAAPSIETSVARGSRLTPNRMRRSLTSGSRDPSTMSSGISSSRMRSTTGKAIIDRKDRRSGSAHSAGSRLTR